MQTKRKKKGYARFTFTYFNDGKQLTQHHVEQLAEFMPSDVTLLTAIGTICNYHKIVIPKDAYVTVHKNDLLIKTVKQE